MFFLPIITRQRFKTLYIIRRKYPQAINVDEIRRLSNYRLSVAVVRKILRHYSFYKERYLGGKL